MKIIIPDEALLPLLRRQARDLTNAFLTYTLFSNDISPDRDTVLADLVAAADFASVDVAAADYTLEQVNGHVASIQADDVVFENTALTAKDVYGYYVTDVTGTYILFVGRFDDAPRTVESGEQTFVTPKLGCKSLYSST